MHRQLGAAGLASLAASASLYSSLSLSQTSASQTGGSQGVGGEVATAASLTSKLSASQYSLAEEDGGEPQADRAVLTLLPSGHLHSPPPPPPPPHLSQNNEELVVVGLLASPTQPNNVEFTLPSRLGAWAPKEEGGRFVFVGLTHPNKQVRVAIASKIFVQQISNRRPVTRCTPVTQGGRAQPPTRPGPDSGGGVAASPAVRRGGGRRCV